MKNYLSKKHLFMAASLLLVSFNSVWADDVVVPSSVYFNDFSSEEGLTIQGSGSFVALDDSRFGKVFQNVGKTVRTNYLLLPSATLSGINDTKTGMTIGFWVNAKNALSNSEPYFWSPMFCALDQAPVAGNNEWTMFYAGACTYLRYNLNEYSGGWCDFTYEQNTDPDLAQTDNNFKNRLNSSWLDNGNWHYYTITITNAEAAQAIVYVDGVKKNSWNFDSRGLFNAIQKLVYPCLGGNQYADLADVDASFAFDDFVVYDQALTVEQIGKIISDKLVQGTQIGKSDFTTDYLAASSDKVKLYPGDSYHYRFINYFGGGDAWLNWHLPVAAPNGTNTIVLRTDWYDDVNGTEVSDHQRGFSTNAADYWANVPSKMDGATVDMIVTFTADKKFVMTSTVTARDNTTWTYNYTSDNENNIDLTSMEYLQVSLSVNHSWLDLLNEDFAAIGATIGANGYATFANGHMLDLSNLPTGLKAYKAKVDGSKAKVNFTEVNVAVPANTGLLLEGTANTTYAIPVAASASALADNDFLVNVDGTTFTPESGYTYYGMNKDSNPMTFGQFAPATVAIPANKAYLKVVNTSAHELTVSFGDVTGIADVRGKMSDVRGDFFDLQGRKVAQPVKGLYIVNGKKVIK